MFEQIAIACVALKLDPLANGLQLLRATALVPPVPPAVGNPVDRAWSEMQGVGPYPAALVPFPVLAARPALIVVDDPAELPSARDTLLQRYPAAHAVALVRGGSVQTTTLDALGEQQLDGATFVYLPPLDALADLRGPDGPVAVVMRLLGPAGCPWDREQTHRSMRRELLEETHEVLEAIDAGDDTALQEELGDLLLQVLMHSEMARQSGTWALGDVYESIAAKLIRRHPHIFGDTMVGGTGDVLRNWDAIKQQERAAKGQAPRGLLDGIAPSLPALATAQKIIAKASKAGFDADSIDPTWNKLHEEIAELRAAIATDVHADDASRARRIAAEYGDLLFATAKLAVWLDLDAESALREAIDTFRARFQAVEQQVQARGNDLRALSIGEKQALWQNAKDTTR